jgi:hypothetical protein
MVEMENIMEFVKNNKAKIGIIATILLLIIIIVGAIFIYKDNKNKEYNVEEVTSFLYYTIYEDGKMGVINADGDILIDPIYDNIKIPNPTKAVFVCQIDDNITVLNDNNEQLFTDYEEVTQIDIVGTVSNIPYEKMVLRYKQNGKYGLIDYEGKIITKPIYEEITGLENKESEMLVKKDGKYGVINQKGATIIKIEYDSIVADGYYTEEQKYALSGYVVCEKTEEGYRYGYIGSKREKVLDVKYNSIYRVLETTDEKNVYLIATRNGQVGVVKNGKAIVNYAYQSIDYDASNDVFILERSSKYGVADNYGNEIIPIEYKQINIKGIYVQTVAFDDTITYFDEYGNTVEAEYESVLRTDNENYFITVDNDGKYGIIDKSGNVVLENKYQYLEYLYNDYYIASNDNGDLGIIDKDDNVLVDFKYDVLQKIDNTSVVEAKILKSSTTDLYSSKLEKIYSNKNVSTYHYEDYIEVSSKDEIIHLDNLGNKLENNVTKNNYEQPDYIGEYHKVYYGYGESYYVKDIEE